MPDPERSRLSSVQRSFRGTNSRFCWVLCPSGRGGRIRKDNCGRLSVGFPVRAGAGDSMLRQVSGGAGFSLCHSPELPRWRQSVRFDLACRENLSRDHVRFRGRNSMELLSRCSSDYQLCNRTSLLYAKSPAPRWILIRRAYPVPSV